jgi:hypothetical protein
MKYFNEILGKIDYNGTEIINIFRKYDIPVEENEKYLDDYVIEDGATPEIISYKLYGTTDLWWTIMVLNQKYDRFFDFPLSTKGLNQYIDYLDGIGQINKLVDAEVEALQSANDEKRYIKVIKPAHIRDFMFKVQDLINERS